MLEYSESLDIVESTATTRLKHTEPLLVVLMQSL
jgi:hypothetical protein